jgi:hypothetical protein
LTWSSAQKVRVKYGKINDEILQGVWQDDAPTLAKKPGALGAMQFLKIRLDLQIVDHAFYAVYLARDFFGFRFLLRRRHLAFELNHTVVDIDRNRLQGRLILARQLKL